MKRALIPIAAVAGVALAFAVVAGTFAAYGNHNPIGDGPRRGGPPIQATAPAITPAVTPAAGVATAAAPVAGTPLTAGQAATLQAMAQEEKLALDLYTALGGAFPMNVWTNIASAESTHLAQVRSLLATYGIADPTAGLAAGSFATTDFATLYASLLASGSASFNDALTAGRTVELDDIARLDAALGDGGLPVDVALVYQNLRRGSSQHLASFERLLGL